MGFAAVESGSVQALSVSADHSTIAGGHASGNVFTWELARPAKPFLHIPPVDRGHHPDHDGHAPGAAILHIGFLGTRHTALVSADEKGMAFSHLATRGMGLVTRSMRTTRILGRYPESFPSLAHQRKPSSVLAFSPLPLGNAEHSSDSMGLVAVLTPYLLVVVSTTPIAQTQYKSPRPKEAAAHGAISAALAWFPSVKLRTLKATDAETSSRVKLAYCWSNILAVLEVVEVESSENNGKPESEVLQFRPRSRWKAEEAIVGLQWLSRSVLAILTITQQLIIMEVDSLQVTDSSDLLQKYVFHVDLFSQQLNELVEHVDEEDPSMRGVVADAFYMSFRAYKGRLFLLANSEVLFGTLSNWADRLLAMMEQGNFIGAIQLATSYYLGETDKATIGLPEDDVSRHGLVEEKLTEMMSASLKYAFGKNEEAGTERVDKLQLEELAKACLAACLSMTDFDFLFDDAYAWYHDGSVEGIFLELLEPHIISGEIDVIPPSILKDLTRHFMSKGFEKRLEEMICNLDPRTMDIDQITSLCKNNRLYDALLYVWSQALDDYTTQLNPLLDLARPINGSHASLHQPGAEMAGSASRIFPYLSYILTGRVYPTGKAMSPEKALIAKAEIYHFFFSGSGNDRFGSVQLGQLRNMAQSFSFPNLRKALDFDAPSFLSMLNEAFEDSFLNGYPDPATERRAGRLTPEQTFGLSVNRQWIVSILLKVMTHPAYEPEDTIFLDMFIARNLSKFSQSIELPGHVVHRVLVDLCNYPNREFAEDCELSVEYLLSMYQPPDLPSLIPLITKACFYRVLKSIYKADKQYAMLLRIHFDDHQNLDAIFDCIKDCLKPSAGLSESQVHDVRAVIVDNKYELVSADVTKTASTLDRYASDLHETVLDALSEDEAGQFQYLQTVLEPPSQESRDTQPGDHKLPSKLVELYVRLLCAHDPRHVSEYVERLKSGDLRLEEVLPSLENSGIIDAAVVLMAREGKVCEAMGRLTQYLHTMEAALIGLLQGASHSPDVANTHEAAGDLVASIQKYSRVGVWLSQGQTRAAAQSAAQAKQGRRLKSVVDQLSTEENLWLDLIDAVVAVTKNITEMLENMKDDVSDETSPQSHQSSRTANSRIITDLRLVVQETFTALLATTSAPRIPNARRTDISFLRILRAFLGRASQSSPSLSNLRAVLATIFQAYTYEESLLSLANRLLDKDLFVHVAEAEALRRRGWRPLGQVCEGCGRKIWGSGGGGQIWDAWQRMNEERLEVTARKSSHSAADQLTGNLPRNGKGKAVSGDDVGGVVSTQPRASYGKDRQPLGPAAGDDDTARVDLSPLVVFSCRHLFHQMCLEKMQVTDDSTGMARGMTHEGSRLVFSCPLCTAL